MMHVTVILVGTAGIFVMLMIHIGHDYYVSVHDYNNVHRYNIGHGIMSSNVFCTI